MSKSKIAVVVVGSLLVLLGFWFFKAAPGPNTDEARYSHFSRTSRSYSRIAFVNHFLPQRAIRFLHLDDSEARHRKRYVSEEAALVASGYFVEVPITVTNPPIQKALNLIAKAFQDRGAWYALTATAVTNQFVVTCRPVNAALCGKSTEHD